MTGRELYLVRHAQAADGDDPGLTAEGRSQTAALAARLAGRPVARILHGPRRRTRETAALLDRPGVPAEVSGLLDDRTPVPSPQHRADYPAELTDWFAGVPVDEHDVDGQFLTAALEQLGALTERGPVVAVTHAFVVGWFVRSVLGAPTAAWTELSPSNAGLTTVDFSRGTARLVAYNA